jgi:1,4-dihydroxy-2-naphthoyl-CoA synthase
MKNESFYGRDLRRFDFTHAEYTDCDFTSASLEKAEYLGAIFTRCNFDAALMDQGYLCGAQFIECSFIQTSIRNAYVFCSSFAKSQLIHTSFKDSMLSNVDLKDANIQQVEWAKGIINRPPVQLDGLDYPITVYDDGHVQFGCSYNTKEWFLSAEGRDMAQLEGLKARRFWGKHRHWLVPFLKSV